MTLQSSPIPMMISLKIAEYYPNDYAFMAVQDEKTLMWSACISAIENGFVTFTLFDMNEYIYEEGRDAIEVLSQMLELSQRSILIMSN